MNKKFVVRGAVSIASIGLAGAIYYFLIIPPPRCSIDGNYSEVNPGDAEVTCVCNPTQMSPHIISTDKFKLTLKQDSTGSELIPSTDMIDNRKWPASVVLNYKGESNDGQAYKEIQRGQYLNCGTTPPVDAILWESGPLELVEEDDCEEHYVTVYRMRKDNRPPPRDSSGGQKNDLAIISLSCFTGGHSHGGVAHAEH